MSRKDRNFNEVRAIAPAPVLEEVVEDVVDTSLPKAGMATTQLKDEEGAVLFAQGEVFKIKGQIDDFWLTDKGEVSKLYVLLK